MQPRLRDVFEKEEQQFFEKLGYDIDQTIDMPHPDTQRTPLHDAVVKGNEKVVQQLLEQKVDVNQYYNSNDLESCPSGTPFLLAVYKNRPNIAELLLAYPHQKVKAEACDGNGVPAVSNAVSRIKVLATLLRAGVNVDQETFSEGNADNYMTALMYAVSGARMTAAKLLIRYGASLKNSQNKSIFDYCFDEIVEEGIKKYITRIASKTNGLIEGLKSVFPPTINNRSTVIDIIASYTSGGAYVKKNDPTYPSRIGLFSQRDERKNSKNSERKVSDNRDEKIKIAEEQTKNAAAVPAFSQRSRSNH